MRQLQAWAAVHQVWVKGDRKDYYEAETDFNAIIKNGLLDVVRKKLNTAGMKISEIEESLAEEGDQRSEVRDQPEDPDGQMSPEEKEIIADRFRQAKQLHEKLNGLIGSPLIDHFL